MCRSGSCEKISFFVVLAAAIIILTLVAGGTQAAATVLQAPSAGGARAATVLQAPSAGGARAAAVLPAPSAGGARAAADGSPERPYIVPMVSDAPRIDGALVEALWQEALKLELPYEVTPGENTPAPVRTEIFLIYDESCLYAAFRCYDPDPAAIQAHFRDRDGIDDEDFVGLALDTFNDNRNNFLLLSNPIGIQEDQIESETGGSSWDAIWDSVWRITERGYEVEMKIPFNQLRFQRAHGTQVWEFDAVRFYPRSHETLIGTFPRNRSNNCYRCQMLKIEGFQGATPGHSIEIAPTVTGVRTDSRDEFPTGDFETLTEEVDFGLTAKWGVTPNMMFSGTVNPDFSQVEADAFQLDINQPFALYYSERRPFFTEGLDYFNTLKGAVYTRTMRDPSWGLKLTGKEGPTRSEPTSSATISPT